MRRVYKYKITMHPITLLELPEGAKFLRAGSQGGRPTLWFEVDPEAPNETRYLTVYGTGHDITSPYQEWRGTFDEGPFVWHVYESSL